METTINQRIKDIVQSLFDGNVSNFARAVNVNQPAIRDIVGTKQAKPGYLILSKIADISTINLEWLLTGKGDMLKYKHQTQEGVAMENEEKALQHSKKGIPTNGYSPFYSNMAVSAGQYDLSTLGTDDVESYIKLPGVSAIAYFPIVGCSMEPRIFAGDIIGVRPVSNLETVDPDKLYLVVTVHDRMLKRLRPDADNPDIIWCISENHNHREFKINVEDIKFVYHVVFAGRLV